MLGHMHSLGAHLSRLQVTQLPGAYSNTYQSQGGVTHSSGHAAHLAVAAFAEGDGQPRGGNSDPHAYRRCARPQFGRVYTVDTGRPRGAVVEDHARSQLTNGLVCDLAFDLYPVGFG